MKKILIVGGGFAGLVAAERLSELSGDEHQITLVSPNSKFTFYPALVRFAFGELEESDVVFDLRKKLDELDVRFIQGEVLHLKPEFHRVQITGEEFNGDVSYDYLVIAIGRRLATEKVPGFYDHAEHLLGVKAATKLKSRIDDFKQGNIVLGLSPDAGLPVPVCETAFALARRLLPDSPQQPVSITVVFPGTVADSFAGADISEELRAAFEKHEIQLVENFAISEIERKEILSSGGHSIPYDLLMLVPPFRGQARLSENGITDDRNFVEVDEYMRVKNLKSVYAVGDIVSFPGPKLAHIAVGQANVAATNIAHELNGDEPQAVYYHEIASIIDQGGGDSIYLHYGVWDRSLYRIRTGRIWGLVKRIHDNIWQRWHKDT